MFGVCSFDRKTKRCDVARILKYWSGYRIFLSINNHRRNNMSKFYLVTCMLRGLSNTGTILNQSFIFNMLVEKKDENTSFKSVVSAIMPVAREILDDMTKESAFIYTRNFGGVTAKNYYGKLITDEFEPSAGSRDLLFSFNRHLVYRTSYGHSADFVFMLTPFSCFNGNGCDPDGVLIGDTPPGGLIVLPSGVMGDADTEADTGRIYVVDSVICIPEPRTVDMRELTRVIRFKQVQVGMVVGGMAGYANHPFVAYGTTINIHDPGVGDIAVHGYYRTAHGALVENDDAFGFVDMGDQSDGTARH